MIYHNLSIMTIQKRSIHDFVKNKDRIIQVKQLIYETFLAYNVSNASDTLKKLITKIYSENSDINETITYRGKNTSIYTYHNNNDIVWVLINKNNKITHLFVEPNSQNKWIWKALLVFFEKEIKKNWYTSIYLKPSLYADIFYKKNWFIRKDNIYLEKNI